MSLEFGDPEVEDLTIEGNEVKATVRLTMQCAECGDEMREYYTEPSESLGDKLHKADGYDDHFNEDGTGKTDECELEVTEEGVEQQEKTEKRKTLFGAEIHYEVKCACGKSPTFYEGHLESDYVSSSEMEECG